MLAVVEKESFLDNQFIYGIGSNSVQMDRYKLLSLENNNTICKWWLFTDILTLFIIVIKMQKIFNFIKKKRYYFDLYVFILHCMSIIFSVFVNVSLKLNYLQTKRRKIR